MNERAWKAQRISDPLPLIKIKKCLAKSVSSFRKMVLPKKVVNIFDITGFWG
jgi:hypothetical protein